MPEDILQNSRQNRINGTFRYLDGFGSVMSSNSPRIIRAYVTFHTAFTASKEACFMVTQKEGMCNGYLRLEG